MGLFSFLNQFNNNNSDIQDDEDYLTQSITKNKNKQISYENLCCSNVPKNLRNLFFEFFTQFIQESTSNTSSVNMHMSLNNFIEILIHRYDLPFFIPIVSFIYINRILRIPNSSVVLSEFTPNRLIAVSIIVASKYYMEDTIYIRNSKWISKVCMGLFKTGELNTLECLFLRSLDYHINVSYSEWQEYLEQIDRGLNELRMKYNFSNNKNFEIENNTNGNNNININTNTNINFNNNNQINSSSKPFSKKECTINNIKQLFALLDNHILNNNQLISYDPSQEPHFSVLYHTFKTPINSVTTSPQQQNTYNSDLNMDKIKQNYSSSTMDISNNNVDNDNDNIDQDNIESENTIEKRNYQVTGILTPPSSSSSSSSQSIYSNTKHHRPSSSISSNNTNPSCNDDIDIIVEDDCNKETNIKEDQNQNSSGIIKNQLSLSSIDRQRETSLHSYNTNNINSNYNRDRNRNQYELYTPSSQSQQQQQQQQQKRHRQLKTNTLSSIYQHNADLKNSLENHSLNGRLASSHTNHYAGNRYHPFSKSSTTPETKRNGLPLFSPIKTSDKPVTVVSPYVYSLLNSNSKNNEKKGMNISSNHNDSNINMLVSPIPSIFKDENPHTNTIKSFSIHEPSGNSVNDIDDEDISNNRNGFYKKKGLPYQYQMSVEDIAAKYSIVKSKNTREHNGDRPNLSINRHSLFSYHSNNNSSNNNSSSNNRSRRNHRRSLSSSRKSQPSLSPINHDHLINLRLGISKKSKTISKNTKINIPTKAKNQKLINTYINSIIDYSFNEEDDEDLQHHHSNSSSTTITTSLLRRFPSITKIFKRFNGKKK